MNETKGFNITLGGKPRRVWLNFRVMQRLGMKGPSDAEALQSRIDEAIGGSATFAKTARLIHDVLTDLDRRECTPDQVYEWLLDEWDTEAVVQFLGKISGGKDADDQAADVESPPLSTAPA